MSFGKIWATAVLAAGLCSGVAVGQEQITPPVQQPKDASAPAMPLPLPRDKHNAAIEGACDVSLVVDEAGKPQKIHVVHCTDKRLKDYAVFSVAGYKFIPAKQNGHPVPAQTMIEVSAHEPAKAAIPDMASRDAAETPADEVGASPVAPEEVHEVGGGVSAPVALYTPEAKFTEKAREYKESGTTAIKIIVDTHGMVQDAHVVESAGAELDQAALDAVKTYRFKPSMKDGKPVAVNVTIKVEFKIYSR